MVVIYTSSSEEEKEVQSLLTAVKDWNKRFVLKRGDTAKMTNIVNGRESDWFIGFEHIRSALTVGYVALGKFCPIMQKKCIKTECSLYLIQRGVGDCSLLWAGVKDSL